MGHVAGNNVERGVVYEEVEGDAKCMTRTTKITIYLHLKIRYYLDPHGRVRLELRRRGLVQQSRLMPRRLRLDPP